VVRLSIPARLCFRDLALAAVLAAIDAERLGADADVRDEIVSALNEAFNNIVLHAYRDIQGGNIEIQVEVVASEVEIRLFDRGRGFDPESVSG
jgi:serine/threonine-protein kinase RsbW